MTRLSRSEAFRQNVAERFDDPDPAQAALIDQAARLMDRLDRAEARIATDGDTVVGGNGQMTSHPLLASSRQDALALARLLGVLFPDDPAAGNATTAGRRAASARWRKAAGKP